MRGTCLLMAFVVAIISILIVEVECKRQSNILKVIAVRGKQVNTKRLQVTKCCGRNRSVCDSVNKDGTIKLNKKGPENKNGIITKTDFNLYANNNGWNTRNTTLLTKYRFGTIATNNVENGPKTQTSRNEVDQNVATDTNNEQALLNVSPDSLPDGGSNNESKSTAPPDKDLSNGDGLPPLLSEIPAAKDAVTLQDKNQKIFNDSGYSLLYSNTSLHHEKNYTSTSRVSTITSTTGTTRPVKQCPRVECVANPASVNAEGKFEMSKLPTGSVSRQACDRIYLFSSKPKNWESAAKECCAFGMQLLSIETTEELQCISDLLNSFDGLNLGGEYLTSGSDFQLSNQFLWCSGNGTATKFGPNVFWASEEPSLTSLTGAKEDCVSIKLSKGLLRKNELRDVCCSESLKYICETPAVPTTKTPCLPFTCQKELSLLDSSGYVKDGAPRSGSFRIGGDRMYYFSSAEEIGNWQHAASECCKMNMHLTAIEKVQEFDDIEAIFSIPHYGWGFLGSWWTGASDQNHEGLFTWCTTERETNVTNLNFAPGKPSGKTSENCIKFNLALDVNSFSDGDCNSKNRYICETFAPDCPFPQCPSHSCAKNARKFELSRKWKAHPEGLFRGACGQQYFFSNGHKTFAGALEECCSYGLKLLSVESADELGCIFEMNQNELFATGTFWTSGTNKGYGCDKIYGWCSSNTLLYPKVTWTSREPIMHLQERCVVLDISTNLTRHGFNDAPCDSTRQFICEGTVPECTPTCPDSCKRNDSLFNSKKELLDVATYGKWTTVKERTYLLSYESVNMTEAYDACCSLGMGLVSLETPRETNDLALFIQNLDTAIEIWTSAVQTDCDFKFKWCSSGEKLLRNDSRWITGQPNDSDQLCVYLIIKSPTSVLFNDGVCHPHKRYACETPTKPCSLVTCPDVQCAVDSSSYIQSQAWIASTGKFRSICGRQYYLHEEALTYKEAQKMCCSFGLRLMALETMQEYECFKNHSNVFGGANMDAWTAGTADGVGCENNWGWCPSGELFHPQIPFGKGFPRAPGDNNCASVLFGESQLPEIHDSSCSNSYYSICEGDVPECKPLCPVKECKKEPALHDVNGDLLEPTQYGIWRSACASTYLFSTQELIYEKAYALCCSIGMNLLTLETDAEVQCLTKLNDKDLMFGLSKFLTSASARNCPNRYEFCPDTGIVIVRNNSRWEAIEFNDKEDVLLLVFNNGLPTLFTDDISYNPFKFICKGNVSVPSGMLIT